ncbi:MAG: hypothetical protein JWP81_3505 [Ferruginibacter sp.]|nr:hypothetical protein [Ferruginibacter sp.]
MNYFNYNGKLYQEGFSIIHADNRGLRYGDGLFETMKMQNGKIQFEDEHFSRLWKGMKILEFDIPKLFTAEQLQHEIKSLVKKNQHEPAARIRLTVIRGDGGLYDAVSHVPAYIIQSWPLTAGSGEWNTNGLVLGIYEATKKSCDILSHIKHNNYLPNVLAALTAKKQKWNDAILLNTYGRICETTIANIFAIKDGVVYTPSLNEGCVAGIMRRIMIRNLEQSDWPVIEQSLNRDDLLAADEVFLTNSMHAMRWVQNIGEVTYGNDLTREICASLLPTIS